MNSLKISLAIFLVSISLKISALSISSFNVRNFEIEGPYSTNPKSLVKVLKKNKSDLFAFQEIVDSENFKILLKETLPTHKAIFSNCGGYGKQKLTFLYDTRIYKVLDTIEDLKITGSSQCNSGVRPLLRVQIQNQLTYEKSWVLLVHLKAGAAPKDITFRKNQLAYIQKIINKLDNYFILGDFNTTQLTKDNGQYFQNFVDKNQLSHSSSQIECSSYWWGGISDGLYYPSLLDHILISPKLSQKFKKISFSNKEHCARNSCNISSQYELNDSFNNVSDHCPVEAQLYRN